MATLGLDEAEGKLTIQDHEAFVSACKPIACALNARLYTLHTVAAQAYVTYLTVAGPLINGLGTNNPTSNAAESETAVIPTESVHPIEPMTG